MTAAVSVLTTCIGCLYPLTGAACGQCAQIVGVDHGTGRGLGQAGCNAEAEAVGRDVCCGGSRAAVATGTIVDSDGNGGEAGGEAGSCVNAHGSGEEGEKKCGLHDCG